MRTNLLIDHLCPMPTGDTVFIREGQDSGKTGVVKKVQKNRNAVCLTLDTTIP
jgi:ribosomal protein L24